MSTQRRLALAFAAPVFSLLALACGGGDGAQAEYVIDPPPADEKPAPGPAVDSKPEDPPPPPFCANAAGVFTAKKDPSNVLFLIDRSGSMQIKLNNGETRWAATKRGLFEMLVQLPDTTQAGAMMFPQGDAPVTFCSINTSNNVYCAPGPARPPKYPRCDAKTYQVGVPNGPLDPAQVKLIEDHVSSADKEFYYGTPLAFALTGAIDAQRKSTLPGTRSVILLTDGNPADCTNAADPTADDLQRVVDAAAAGSAGTPLVRTFVMGVVDGTKGATPENLSKIAKAGATGRTANCETTNDCHYALNASTFTADIKKAFDQISLQAFDCTFDLPPQTANNDPNNVNVNLTTTAGAQGVTHDTNHQNGWDYLPNGTQIQLYGQACTDVKNDAAAKVDIVVGCKTVEKPGSSK
jgi:hypothetical protein